MLEISFFAHENNQIFCQTKTAKIFLQTFQISKFLEPQKLPTKSPRLPQKRNLQDAVQQISTAYENQKLISGVHSNRNKTKNVQNKQSAVALQHSRRSYDTLQTDCFVGARSKHKNVLISAYFAYPNKHPRNCLGC
jgi:hypothetical protein